MDYKFQTTFWADFNIAEVFGEKAIRDTAKRAFEEWKDNTVYLTELIMVLNHKCWDFYSRNNYALSDLYSELYYMYNEKALDYLEEQGNQDSLTYYIRTLD